MRRKPFAFSTTHIIMLSFLGAILVGALLLMLPISSADRTATPFADALFTSTSATCVTGLVVESTVSYWSLFGQCVILLLIQIGGLGIITVFAGLSVFLNRKIGLSDRVLLQDSFNLSSISGVVAFLKKVISGTFVVEAAGALLYMFVFVPDFGAKGMWISVFTAVSAFCNAGLDIIADDSLCAYATNPLVNTVTCLLVVFGGIGFIVWWDVIRVFRERKSKKGRLLRRLTLHSKIALTCTAALILLGAALVFAFEYDNAGTMKGFTLPQKIQAAFFQSVTTRTAGFATLDQGKLLPPTAFVTVFLMFVGGSPVGTAGGIKTVTFVVLAASAFSAIKNKDSVTLFGKSLSKIAIGRAMAVSFMAFMIVFISTISLSALTGGETALDVLFEATSAFGTVGLSRGLTPKLDTLGKYIVTATMYFGRVGPISLAIAFNLKKENKNIIKEPTENISVG